MLKILSSFILGLGIFTVSILHIHSQTNSRYFMDEIWQKNTANPSHHTMEGDYENDTWNISLPNYGQAVLHSGPSLENLYRIENDTTLVITPQKWIDKLADDNTLRTRLDFQTFNLSYRKNKLIFSFGHSLHSNFAVSYSKSLMNFIANGNANFINKPINLGHKIEGTAYGKWSLGLIKKSDKFTVGLRLNVLNGIQHLSTPKSDVSLTTGDKIYQLRFNMDYEMRSAGKFDLNLANSKNFITLPSIEEIFTANLGYSIDLGFDWRINKKLSLEGAVLDLGQINWTQNIENYTLKGEYTYEGVDIFNHNLENFQFSDVKDSLVTAFDLKPNSNEKFTTKLPWSISLQAKYQINNKLRIQALFFNQFGNIDYQTIAFGANYTLVKGFNIGANYAVNDGSHQLGLNSSWRWKHVQIFIATDNIIGLFDLKNSLNGGGMIGANVYF